MDPLLIIAKRIAFNQTGYIKKEKNKYCVRSESNPKWNGGCYDTKAEAAKRLGEVEHFKKK